MDKILTLVSLGIFIKRTYVLFCILPPIVFLVYLVPLTLFAASYSVSPLLIDRDVEKRDIIAETITITNNDTRKIRMYPTVNEVTLGESGSIEEFIPPSMSDRTNTITSWLQIKRSRIELDPGDSIEITLTIHMNPEVEAGEYHAFIGFAEGSNKAEAQSRLNVAPVPGTLLRLAVDQEQNQFLRLERFTVDRFVSNTQSEPVSYTLINPGNDPVVPAGEIIFYNNNGDELTSIPVNPSHSVVPPQDKLTFSSNLPEDLSIGKFKAFLSIEYGEHLTASIHDTSFFYVMPLRNIILLFGGIIAVTLLLTLYAHRRLKKVVVHGDAESLPMYRRTDTSESMDHDIDLSKKNDK